MEEQLREQLRASYAAWLATERLYEDFARRWGLRYNGLFVLQRIAQSRGQATLSGICEGLYLPKQTVHAVLRSFEGQGYVRAEVDEKDHRNKTLHLTEAGQRLADRVLSALDRVELAALGRMTAAEREALLRCNRLYHEYMDEAMKEDL